MTPHCSSRLLRRMCCRSVCASPQWCMNQLTAHPRLKSLFSFMEQQQTRRCLERLWASMSQAKSLVARRCDPLYLGWLDRDWASVQVCYCSPWWFMLSPVLVVRVCCTLWVLSLVWRCVDSAVTQWCSDVWEAPLLWGKTVDEMRSVVRWGSQTRCCRALLVKLRYLNQNIQNSAEQSPKQLSFNFKTGVALGRAVGLDTSRGFIWCTWCSESNSKLVWWSALLWN